MLNKNQLVLVVFAFVAGVIGFASKTFAQGPPPPPAPLIYSKPSPSEIQDFTSSDDLFKIGFPGMPKVTKREINGGKAVIYETNRKGSASAVAVLEFESDRSLSIELITISTRKALTDTAKNSIVVDKAATWNGHDVQDFEYVYDGMRYRRVRTFVVGKRVFQLHCDVTNWHIIGDKVKAEWREESERFFNSFTLL